MAAAVARYDQIADFYEERSGKSVSDPGTAALLNLAGDVGGLRLLDVACGQGRVARELARRGATVTGVDLSAELLAKARAYQAVGPLDISYLQADVTASGLLDGQVFDLAVCNYGLTDIDDLTGLLVNVARLLRAGGAFVFSLLHPCFPGWDSDAPSSWPPREGYYREGWWLAGNTGYRGKVGSSHRMISSYLNSLISHGLVLDHVAEPTPSQDMEARRPPGAAPVPFYLVARCVRR
jgi:2-polyprenyl-3-methyl-5-hydroxy-6-metoxy-1,4-benzoquinol methylase